MDIFVGSLPFKLKESQLQELFEKFGEVTSVTIVIDKVTRQNMGYGFVEMPDAKQAKNAIELLNGAEIMDRKIIVSKSEVTKDKPVKRKASKKSSVKSKPEEKGIPEKRSKMDEKSYAILRSKRFPKKKKINVISKHSDDDKPQGKKKKRGGTKLAKNFKVGSRKKR